MPDRPQFVDNRGGNTLSSAINQYLDDLSGHLADDPDLDVVTGYFNPRGYFSVADGLEEVGEVRILLGAEPDQEGIERWRQPEEPRGEEYEKKRIEEALQTLDENLERDRDLLGFSRKVDEELQALVEFLESDRVEVRRHESRFIHGKAYLFSGSEGVISGSSNLTGGGMNANLELNIGSYSPYVTGQVQTWFEELWEESEPYDLAELYKARFEHYDPYLIYLRVLYEWYGDEIDEEREDDGGLQLTNFQEDAVRRANRFLEEHGGVIVADEVGLGKTYIAGELLRQYVNQNRQRALVVAPAYLRDGMWKGKQAEWGVQFEAVSYADLRSSDQLGGDRSGVLRLDVDDYQLVVIDEAHAFRNPGTQQSHALRTLLRGDPPKDVVMLTATPVNNSLWDLYYLLYYFIKNDAAFAHEGIRSLRDRFKNAQAENPSDLSPDMLFDVLDRTTVRRTRRFIKDYYENATMPDGDGGEVRINFPEPKPRRVDYTFSETFGDEYFRDVAEGLAAGDRDETDLTLARYRPTLYLEGEDDASELSLIGLLRTGMLKRFESSSHAFANTLQRMIEQNQAALNLMEEGYFPATGAIEEWVETDSDEAMEEVLAEAEDGPLPMAEMEADPEQLRADLQNDIQVLKRWHEGASSVGRQDDEKLLKLKDVLEKVASRAREDAKGALSEEEESADFRRNRKVLLFSYYEDTVDWIYKYLEQAIEESEELSCYKGRVAAVAGDGSKYGVTRDRAVHGFSPNSGDAPAGVQNEFDILITTDVLGQGVNLQEARTVINYDLPWNPMRVVQRNGRIDRVNSPHPEIFPLTFFPEDRLDQLLDLEFRVREKLTQAARSIGVSGGVIPEMETLEQNFAERKEEVDSLYDEESDFYEQGGTDAAAYSGEEYRQELRRGLQDKEDRITGLPWAAGSGFKGSNPGHFFCARIGEETYFRFVPLRGGSDDIVRDTLTCLQRIECTEETDRDLPDPIRDQTYDAWQEARADIFQQWQEQTDPRNVQPDVRKLFREVAEHVRQHWPDDWTYDRLRWTIDAVEAPYGRRYERELREVYEEDGIGPVERTRQLYEKITDLGLQPYEAPEPLPPIEEEEIKLVCWMAVAPQNTPIASQVEGL